MNTPQRDLVPRNLSVQELPQGWNHPNLILHRLWFNRQNISWRARQMLVMLVPGLLLGYIFGNPWCLLIALTGFAWNPAWPPVRLERNTSLYQIEKLYGAAYTTALITTDDGYGFATRLQKQAEQVVRNATLPNPPWLELLGAFLLASLLFLVPTHVSSATNADRTNPTVEQAMANAPENLGSTNPNTASSGDGAPATNSASGPDSKGPDDQTSNQRLGRLKSGQSNTSGQDGTNNELANASNEDLNKAFERALEQGAVRSIPNTPTPKPSPNPGKRTPGASSGQDPGGQGQSDPASGSGGNTRGRKTQPGQSPNDSKSAAQNGQNQSRNGGAQNPPNKENSGPDTAQPTTPNAQGQPSADQAQRRNSDLDRRGPQRSEDDSSAFGQGQTNGQTPNGQAGKGSNQSGNPQAVGRSEASEGKLEFLPGNLAGKQASSSALPLPGDPSQPLTSTPGSTTYRHAVEGAVLDPRLPPEYQELLKRYYR